MSITEQNWQVTRPTIRERIKFSFNSSLFSDVKFLVGKRNDIESKQQIPAGRDILHGVYLFVSQNNAYAVALTPVSDSDGVLIASTKCAFSSVSHSSGKYYGFDVLLDEPILLRKGGTFYLEARVFGGHSWYGIQGHHTVRCCNVTFVVNDNADKT